MNHYHTQYKHHVLNIDAENVDQARKEAIAYFIRFGSPSDVRENVMITGRVYGSVEKPSPTVSTNEKTVYKARDIIDGKFLEDYFYNS